MEAALLMVLCAASFLVRLWPVSQVRFWDETVYLQNAEVICCAKTNYSELDSRPPLLSLLFVAAFMVWHSIYAASVVTAALNAAGSLFLYLAGQRLAGRAAAAIAALLLAFLPFFVSGTTGNSLLTDSPAVTLVLICFWILTKAADENAGSWFICGGFVGSLAVLMRFASLPAVAVLSVLCLRPWRRIKAVLQFTAGFALGVGPYLLWSRAHYGGFLTTLRHGWEYVSGSIEPPLYYLQNFVSVFSWMTVAGLALWAAALLLRLKRGTKAGAERPSLLWQVFLVAWVLILLAYYTAIPHKELRYILPLAPPLLLLAATGFAELLRIRNQALRVLASAVVAAGFVYTCAPDIARFHYPVVSPYVSEEKQVADYLNSIASPSAVLYASFNYPVFGYYTRLTVRRIDEQGETFYRFFPEIMTRDGYLLLYPELNKDPRMDWVESNPHFRRVREFPSLIVYDYRVKPD